LNGKGNDFFFNVICHDFKGVRRLHFSFVVTLAAEASCEEDVDA